MGRSTASLPSGVTGEPASWAGRPAGGPGAAEEGEPRFVLAGFPGLCRGGLLRESAWGSGVLLVLPRLASLPPAPLPWFSGQIPARVQGGRQGGWSCRSCLWALAVSILRTVRGGYAGLNPALGPQAVLACVCVGFCVAFGLSGLEVKFREFWHRWPMPAAAFPKLFLEDWIEAAEK